jgi:hypothetical protein
MPFQYNPDASLDLYFENESPGTGKVFQRQRGRLI